MTAPRARTAGGGRPAEVNGGMYARVRAVWSGDDGYEGGLSTRKRDPRGCLALLMMDRELRAILLLANVLQILPIYPTQFLPSNLVRLKEYKKAGAKMQLFPCREKNRRTCGL